MRKVLTLEFFNRPATVVAKDLLGKYLVRLIDGTEHALMLTELEAYAGPKDLASHARFGKTARTAPMFGPPGTIYVYFTYGMHYMLNLACLPEGEPSAVLVRGASEVIGPGRVTKFLQIDTSLTNRPLGKASGLWVEDRGVVVPPRQILRTPRIGIDYAGAWVGKPWRFVIKKEKADKKKAPTRSRGQKN
jgi:DNA-3-methyladenine glycosylase